MYCLIFNSRFQLIPVFITFRVVELEYKLLVIVETTYNDAVTNISTLSSCCMLFSYRS